MVRIVILKNEKNMYLYKVSFIDTILLTLQTPFYTITNLLFPHLLINCFITKIYVNKITFKNKSILKITHPTYPIVKIYIFLNFVNFREKKIYNSQFF